MHLTEPVTDQPDVGDPAVVAELRGRIVGILERKGLEGVLAIGQLLFARVHAGRRDRVGESTTIASIAAEKDFPASAQSLHRAVGVYLQWLDMPKDVRDRLGPSQHYALLPVADPETRDELAEAAAQERLTKSALEARVRKALGKPTRRPPTRPGRPSTPALSVATRSLSPWTERMASDRPPTKSEVAKVREHIAGLRALLDQIEAWAAAPAEELDDDGATPTAAGRFRV